MAKRGNPSNHTPARKATPPRRRKTSINSPRVERKPVAKKPADILLLPLLKDVNLLELTKGFDNASSSDSIIHLKVLKVLDEQDKPVANVVVQLVRESSREWTIDLSRIQLEGAQMSNPFVPMDTKAFVSFFVDTKTGECEVFVFDDAPATVRQWKVELRVIRDTTIKAK